MLTQKLLFFFYFVFLPTVGAGVFSMLTLVLMLCVILSFYSGLLTKLAHLIAFPALSKVELVNVSIERVSDFLKLELLLTSFILTFNEAIIMEHLEQFFASYSIEDIVQAFAYGGWDLNLAAPT